MNVSNVIHAECLVPGKAEGRVTALAKPLSLWGGFDPARGTVSDVNHPDHGAECDLAPTEPNRSKHRAKQLDVKLAKAGYRSASLHYGIRIEDQRGFGSLAGDALLVDEQRICAPSGHLTQKVPLRTGTNRVTVMAFDDQGFSSNAAMKSSSERCPKGLRYL